ncbi:hypothetical protein FQR65_LT07301 [Abscondita terminalis]|nr:hypothetical protein FQR65_LT07301 [Abscondita terminalis]
MSLLKALDETKKEFFSKSSLHGFKYLLKYRHRTLFDRFFWFCLLVGALYGTVSLLLFSWNEFVEEPTVTILENSEYPISLVPFPGISICDLNKINRRKVEAFAEELALRSNYSIEYVEEIVSLLGKLYDFGGGTLSDDLLFQSQSFMDEFAHITSEVVFDPYNTLKRLSPSCTELLSKCSWNGVVYNCTDLFVSEVTIEGFCCVFNYLPARNSSRISKILKVNKNKVLRMSNSDGLSVVVHHDVDDYFYPLLSSAGALIDIFNARDFPDATSGSLQQRLIAVGVEIFFEITATVIYAVPEVKKYSISTRKCIFPEESKTLFGTRYSRSDCLLDCRIKSMMALCQCVPFTYVGLLNGSRLPQCNLLDIPCLYKYQHKWRRLFPSDYKGDDMETDKQDSLQCNHCTPSCSNVWYSASNYFTYLDKTRNGNKTNFSVVHVTFRNEYAERYKHDVVYYWYEIVSKQFGRRLQPNDGLKPDKRRRTCLFFYDQTI